MDDSAGEVGGQSQGHGCSSYPLSFPSQPPDIKNWFSSYEYESPEPEVPELVADPAVDNGSETQDPFEGKSFGDQSEPEVFAGKYLVPVDKSATKPATKRKQSLRTLFGESFLDKVEEATETESQSLLPVQRNAPEPLSDCITSFPDTKQSKEGSTEHSKVLVDCDGISSVDTQDSTPADQEVECCKQSVDCDDARLSSIDVGEGFTQDVIHQIEPPLNSNGANLAGTEKTTQFGVEDSLRPACRNSFILAGTENSPLEETRRCKLALGSKAGTEKTTQFGVEDSLRPACRNSFILAGTENSPIEETRRCKLALGSKRPQEIVASDGFIAVKRKEKRPEECRMNKIPRHPMGREKGNGKLQENNDISERKVLVQEQTRRPLADRTNFSEVAAAAAAPAQEVSRKWKCPRKGKPFVGRPLKQLRLEQWVRRMN